MAGEVASAYVSLLPSAKGFGKSTQRQIGPQMDSVAKKTGSRFGKVFAYSSMSPLKAIGAAAIGLFAIAKVKQFFQGAIAEARESQKVSAITAQVIKSTGGAAQISADQVGRLATSISNMTGIDDEAIQSGANLLLTFKNIRNEAGAGNNIFDQTTRIMTDMSVAMGTDAKSSAIQLGKALNDPVKGITALTRVGVTFTDQQKRQIETLVESGKRLAAQKIILNELRSEFGGTAAAAATAGDKFRTTFANFQEAIGTALLPYLDRLLLKGVEVIRFLQNDVPRAFAAFKAAVAPVVAIVRTFVEEHLQAFKLALAALGGSALTSLISLIGGSLVSALGVLVGALVSPVGLIGALAGAAVYAYVHFESFRAKVNELAVWSQQSLVPALIRIAAVIRNDVAPAALAFANFVAAEFYPTMIRFWAAIAQRVQPALVALAQTYVTRVLPIQKQVVAAFRQWADASGPLIKELAKLVGGVILLSATISGKAIPPVLRFSTALSGPAFGALITVMNASNRAMTALGNLAREFGQAVAAAGRFASGVVSAVGKAINVVQQIPARAKAALGNVGSLLYSSGQELIDGFGRGMLSRLGDIASKAASIASKIKGYFPGSPVKWGPLTSFNNGHAGKALLQLFADGLIAGAPIAEKAAADAATKVQSAILDRLTSMRDSARGILDGLRSDFASLRDSVASAFAPDVFSAPDRFAFMGRLDEAAGNLTALRGALRKLRSWKIDPGFLSQLFASGNGALILDLASGTRGEARSSAQMFGAVDNLTQQLGRGVARNEIGPKIDRTNARLERIEKAIDRLPKNFGREINGAATAGHKGRTP